MGIRLQEAGFRRFEILEKAGAVGGTWYWNRYPGCACDIPAHLYSFSFEIKRDWSRPYAPQPEILAYLEHCAEKYGLLPHCRFGDAVRRTRWNEAAAEWTLELDSGRIVVADVVVSAVGMFNEIATPAIPGLESFAGTVFHSARWNAGHDLTGERVGVIGSAASAVQLVPEIVERAGPVHLFQRTANWIAPKQDDPYTEKQLERFRTDPGFAEKVRRNIFDSLGGPALYARVRAEMEAACRAGMAAVADPALRARLTPDHPWGVTRPLCSNVWYPAFNRSNLELVTDPIERITPTGIATARHADPGDRLRDGEVPVGGRSDGPRRARARRRVERRGAGLQGRHDRGLPQPLHALRAEHQRRLDHHDDRVPGGPRPAADPAHRARGPRLDRRPRSGDGRLQRRAPEEARGPRALARTRQRLLPGRERPHRHAVAGVDA
jgi:cation diffusion facilitator CzcD-associated flavoprotein CzcO